MIEVVSVDMEMDPAVTPAVTLSTPALFPEPKN
nr:hypothetical protein [uncultured bacterium]